MYLFELLNGNLSLQKFYGENPPPYAVLSHTWATDEVSFKDMTENTGQDKPTYAKVRLCAREAARDHLQYIWLYTCCIDRSNSSELSEAINSIFRWLSEAAICYVYLSDVDSVDSIKQMEQFKKSIWFTRGWTLQELIAPRLVNFYAADGSLIGSKSELAAEISEITGIPADVLRFLKRPNEYSVPERMSWASKRQTTRPEDRAYCLMGLFDISLPVLYGEGGDSAFQRLQKEIMSLTNQSSGLRLLVVGSKPLTIETFVHQEDEPEYAILSHTWSTNEVSFQDILVGKAPGRRGYHKIMGCCEQASRDGFKYLWVDTCCIDKTSSAELQEAICSMYKWYKKAKVCYAYLEDFEEYWSPAQLNLCKWFGRGWTLQELIAPSVVKFYNSKWDSIGTKASLCQQIAEITGIDQLVLQGENPTTRTVAERMSWASKRSTSRIEDTAYSLMGLFDVFMPMLYGEGDRAFLRLQEEIMKQSEDYTIFAWKSAENNLHERGIFARSPAEFGNVVRSTEKQVIAQFVTPFHELPDPAALTSRGLKIGLPLLFEYGVEDRVSGA